MNNGQFRKFGDGQESDLNDGPWNSSCKNLYELDNKAERDNEVKCILRVVEKAS